MSKRSYHAWKYIPFSNNEQAVLGLPMRLTVSLIIGTVALAAILAYISNPCLFPGKMVVTVSPMVNATDGGNPTEILYHINVTSPEGYPIYGAQVLIKGLSGVVANQTNARGYATVSITVQLEEGVNEGYLDVTVKAPCKETFSQDDLLKIIRG